MTLSQIQSELAAANKPSSEAQVRRYFAVLGIERQGARQRPAQFPDTATAQILAHLNGHDLPPMDTASAGLARIDFDAVKRMETKWIKIKKPSPEQIAAWSKDAGKPFPRLKIKGSIQRLPSMAELKCEKRKSLSRRSTQTKKGSR